MKRLVERIAENDDGKKWRNTRTIRLAVLLKMKSEIQEALNFGWSLRTIWNQLISEKTLDCGYDAFRKTWGKIQDQKIETRKSQQEVVITPEGRELEKKEEKGEERNEPVVISEPERKTFSFENIKR